MSDKDATTRDSGSAARLREGDYAGHVVDKATKLETIFDRINLVDTRFEG